MSKKYWLFKSEPRCFSIDDLASERRQTTTWDGVRNYQARNMLRDDVKKGDEVFFYNSNSKPTGIVGICTVVKEGYPDFTALDPNNEHFDPKASKDKPVWYMVDVKLKKKFLQIIPLSLLKETVGLEDMMVCQKGSRLSIQPVKPQEWKIVLKLAEKLV